MLNRLYAALLTAAGLSCDGYITRRGRAQFRPPTADRHRPADRDATGGRYALEVKRDQLPLASLPTHVATLRLIRCQDSRSQPLAHE
jgi:hypothetical protein